MIWNCFAIAGTAVKVLLIAMLVSGCGWFGDKDSNERDPNDYLQAQPEADLQVQPVVVVGPS